MTTTSASTSVYSPTAAGARSPGPYVVAAGGVDPESVLRAARALAHTSRAGVAAVTVAAPFPMSVTQESIWMLPPEYEQQDIADCTARLDGRVRSVGDVSASWGRAVLRGSPALALSSYAREHHAALLIVGIGRHRPLDRIFGAETALRIIQRSPCPVLVIHPGFEGPFTQVVMATDFSPSSAAAARAAIPLLGPAATVHLLHVWQPSGYVDGRRAAADEAYARSLPEHFRRFSALMNAPATATIRMVTREGDAAERVLDYAAMHHVDLITAGRHGRNLLQRLLVGSQTTALLRSAAQSLLVAPEPPFAEHDRMQLALTGSSEIGTPGEWETALRALRERNQGRTAALEIDDIAYNAQVVESGYVFLDAHYEPSTTRIEITLGDAAQKARRTTRAIGNVDSLAITANSAGRDIGLRISHGGGHTALTFVGA